MNTVSTPFTRSADSLVAHGDTMTYAWLFESSPDCVKILELDGCVRSMNPRGMYCMEIDRFSDIAGELWPGFWPEQSRALVSAALATAAAGGTGHFNAFCPTAKGTPRWWDVMVTPILGAGGVEGLLAVSRDVTELHEAAEQQRELAARLRFALEAAQFGEWELDLSTHKATCSLRHDQCFGYAQPVQDWHFDLMLTHVHPDDRETVRTAIEAVLQPPHAMHFEARVIWPDGSLHWIGAQGSLFRGHGGAPDRIIGVVSEITDRMRITEALRDANRNKDEFLAMLAHELRNPLAPISSAAQLLTTGRADPAQTARAGAVIARQATHMNRLLDDLLDVSRVTQGLVTLDKTALELKRVVADAIEQARPLIEERGHQLVVQQEPAPAMVLGDEKRLVQVLTNLLNNAAKYTPRGGKVIVRLGTCDTNAVISVHDDGIGMAQDTLRHAFELFAQAARSPDRSSGGLGLGLALVRSLVEQHGGTVAAYSAGPGAGSEFTVTLPLLVGQAEVVEPAAAADAWMAPVKLRVLVVDDNRDAAETLAMYLEASGHDTFVAFSGQEALELAPDLLADAYLLDVGLPDMSGHELVRRLQALPVAAAAAMIAVTGYGGKLDLESSAAAGFHHHLTKPVDTARLHALLSAITPFQTSVVGGR